MARVPLYRKAETEMLRRIRSGAWARGQRLGNEFELAEEFGVSQGTMRRALISLESMGYLARKPGRGTVIAEPQEKKQAPQGPGFDRLMLQTGAAPAFEVFRAKVKPLRGDDEMTALFGTERLCKVERMLKLGPDRVALDEIVLPEALVPDIDPEAGTDLPDFLDAHGIDVARIDDRVTATLCTMGQSVALSVDRNTALLCLTRTAQGTGHQTIARQSLLLADGKIGYDIGLVG